MKARQLRTGNIVLYENCYYEVRAVNVTGIPKLNVKAINHDWGTEVCGVNEVEGADISADFLKKNGFVILNKALPELWIKPLGAYRYIRYHSGVHYMDFETVNSFQRVPWPVRYIHQMQNACTDYDLEEIKFLV